MDERESSDGIEWQAAQQKYWDAWLDLTRRGLRGGDTDPRVPGIGVDGVLKWWEAVAQTAPPTTRDFFGRLVGLNRPYFEMVERFSDGAASDASTVVDEWLDGLQDGFRSLGAAATPDADPLRATLAAWELPLETWRRTMSSLLPPPGDVLRGTVPSGRARTDAGLHQHVDQLLAMPAVGYTRETQEQHQQLMRRTLEYVRALQEYNLALAQIGIRSAERLRAKIHDTADAAPIDGLRKLYDLWVEACEEIYGEFVMSEEHSRLYGCLVNSLTALKRHTATMLDEIMESMNLPSRREIDTLHRRVHQARRESHELRAALTHVQDRLEAASRSAPRARRKAKTH